MDDALIKYNGDIEENRKADDEGIVKADEVREIVKDQLGTHEGDKERLITYASTQNHEVRAEDNGNPDDKMLYYSNQGDMNE